MRAPGFWYAQKGDDRGGGLWPRLLSPLGHVYALAGRIRTKQSKPFVASVPVVCIGNLTAGGTGKTPLTLALAKELSALGERVFVLTRGYGGKMSGPLMVNPGNHASKDVGDEALLLSRRAPTVVARNRALGAQFAVTQGASVILMDDGYQNPGLKKDFSIVVVDGETGFGNGKVIPAGPLREPIDAGLERANAIVMMGHAIAAQDADRLALTRAKAPLFTGMLEPQPQEDVIRQRVLAFAGIGRPEKFFETAETVGYRVVATKSFADHHAYSEKDMETLFAEAKEQDAQLLTTEKDLVRLTPETRQRIKALPVKVRINDMTGLMDLLRRSIQSHRAGAATLGS